jgi:hypothetical protein
MVALPFRSLLSARTAVRIAIAWPPLTALLAALYHGTFGVNGRWTAAASSVVSVAIALLATPWALAASSRVKAAARMALAAAVEPCVMAVQMAPAIDARPAMSIGMKIVALSIGALFLAVWTAIPVFFSYKNVRRANYYEGADRTLLWLAAWVASPTVVTTAGCIVLRVGPPFTDARMLPPLLANVLVPGALAAIVGVRVHLRRQWLARVLAGNDKHWRIVDATGHAASELPSYIGSQPNHEPRVLARVCDPGDPFRDTEIEPVAVLDVRPN